MRARQFSSEVKLQLENIHKQETCNTANVAYQQKEESFRCIDVSLFIPVPKGR
jgi:hypothetical protein